MKCPLDDHVHTFRNLQFLTKPFIKIDLTTISSKTDCLFVVAEIVGGIDCHELTVRFSKSDCLFVLAEIVVGIDCHELTVRFFFLVPLATGRLSGTISDRTLSITRS